MRGTEFPVVKDIVLIGGGHAHVAVLRRFGMAPINGARITLISPEADTPYSGMLPGLIAGHYAFDDAHIDLGPLAQFAGARFFETAVERIDPAARLVYCKDGRPPVAYDILSINTGSTPVVSDDLNCARDIIPVKPVSQFLAKWRGLKERVLREPERQVGIVGAGAGGIELLLSMQYALEVEAGAATGQGPGRFHAFTRDHEILKTHGARVRDALGQALVQRGVTVHTNFDVTAVDADGVGDGERRVALDEVVWVTGAQPPAWFANSGLDVDDRGFMAVDKFLRSTSHAEIFGGGDAVSMVRDARPKSGVFAVRQGPVLAHNVRASVLGRRLRQYAAQRAFLSLISSGDKYAIASYAGWSVAGAWVWRWKDRIDRSFMRKFNELANMAERTERSERSVPTVADVPRQIAEAQMPDAMRCAGCGAKVGSAILTRALAQVDGMAHRGAEAPVQHGVVLGIGDDAAVIEAPPGQALVQTVDSFPAMIDDPFEFGQIAANHCLGDLYAMGATPHSALAVVSLPFAPDAKREADLVQLLAGAQRVLQAARCVIVGGHTSEASALTLGFSLNGFAEAGRLMRKAGLRGGLALILTKPIGSGAVFAAHGRGCAKGRWLRGAVANALVSSKAAAEVLRDHGAEAMTDVTGFGVAGHLGEMLAASGVGAALRLGQVALLEGAQEITRDGIVSSLYDSNLVWQEQIEADGALKQTAAYQLLFDPQTAGGLLAGVPLERAPAALEALQLAGYPAAAVIGETLPVGPSGWRLTVQA